MTRIDAKIIENLLPQTQCGLCGFKGCKPYSEALAENKAAINLCPPGGIETLQALASLLNVNAEIYETELTQKIKQPKTAVIREESCIGCTKCITACPVDAIIGSAKKMHTIIADWCTGCELCIPPCPVDCIDLVDIKSRDENNEIRQNRKSRYEAKNNRLLQQKSKKQNLLTEDTAKDYLQQALARARKKKSVLI